MHWMVPERTSELSKHGFGVLTLDVPVEQETRRHSRQYWAS
jgi:hypothetical protein